MDHCFLGNKLQQGGPLEDYQQQLRTLTKSFGGTSSGRFNNNNIKLMMMTKEDIGKVFNILETTENILHENNNNRSNVSFSPLLPCCSSSNNNDQHRGGQSIISSLLEPLPLGPQGSRRLVNEISLINCADSLLLGESKVDREALFDVFVDPFLTHQDHTKSQDANNFKCNSSTISNEENLKSKYVINDKFISSLFTDGPITSTPSTITITTSSTKNKKRKSVKDDFGLLADKEQPATKRLRLQHQDELQNEATFSLKSITTDFHEQQQEESNFILDPSIFDLDEDNEEEDETTKKTSYNNIFDLDRQAAMVQAKQHQLLHHHDIAQQDEQKGGEQVKQRAEKRFRTFQFDQWIEKFQELIQFRSKYGHCLVPHSFPPNQPLAKWVKRQRYQYKLRHQGRHSTLTKERQFELEKMGFVWDSHQAMWAEHFEELKTFKEKHGHCSVPAKYVDKALAIWVKCQRRQYKLYRQGCSSSMTQSRIEQMESLGFDWNPRNL